MFEEESMQDERRAVRPIGPEDIAPGDYLAVVGECVEMHPMICRCCWSVGMRDRFEYIPEEAGSPLRVVCVCLPFVYASDTDGEHRTLDVRRHRLARLSREYAKRVWKRTKDARKGKRKKGCKDDD